MTGAHEATGQQQDVPVNMNIGGQEVVRREPFVFKVYATLFVMLLTTVVFALYFRQPRPSSAQQNRQNAVNPAEQAGNGQPRPDGQQQNNQAAQGR